MQSCYATVLGREIHYTEWGDAETASTSVVMVHGFVRTCRDFDHAAEYLSTHHGARVICPDMPGRGLSQWSPDPESEYNPVFYSMLIASLLKDTLGITRCVFFGTSMGGIIGLIGIGSGGPLAALVTRLVLNDVGPHVNPAALQRIMAYVVQPPVVRRVTEMIAATSEGYRGFGYHLTADQRWRLLEPCLRRLEDGSITLHYDPSIIKGIKPPPPGTPDLWFFYDKIACPTLVVRGQDSDVLLPETLEEMLLRGPKPQCLIIADSAHAPAFMDADDCKALAAFVAGV